MLSVLWIRQTVCQKTKKKKKKKEKRAVGKGRQKGVDCVPVHLLAASLASSASFSVGRN